MLLYVGRFISSSSSRDFGGHRCFLGLFSCLLIHCYGQRKDPSHGSVHHNTPRNQKRPLKKMAFVVCPCLNVKIVKINGLANLYVPPVCAHS